MLAAGTMLRFALVGCGRIAVRHAELLARNQIAGAELAAVCDVVPAKAERTGRQYSRPYFTDMHEMMRKVSPDVVVVLTESGNHAQNVVSLAQYQRSIIVEKPMALTLDDADAMIQACDKAGVRMFVVKQNRFNVPVVKLREALERAWPQAAAVTFNGRSRPGDPFSLVADSQRLAQLGFDWSVTVEEGIVDYVRWFLRQADSGAR